MRKLDRYERELLRAYEKGTLVSARPTKGQRRALGEAARFTTRSTRARARAARAAVSTGVKSKD